MLALLARHEKSNRSVVTLINMVYLIAQLLHWHCGVIFVRPDAKTHVPTSAIVTIAISTQKKQTTKRTDNLTQQESFFWK